MIDNRTERLSLPLPNIDNYLEDDVVRLGEALTTIDELMATQQQLNDVEQAKVNKDALSAAGGVDLIGNAEPSPYYRIPGKTFTTGATITTEKQCLKNEANGRYYEYVGVIPTGGFIVAPNSTPTGSDWVDRGNMILLDEFRLHERAVWARFAAELGLTLVAGSFEEGATLTSPTQALLCFAEKAIYTWGGPFNKMVGINSTPATSGGIGAGAWVDKTDVTLRGELTENFGNVFDLGLQPDGITDNSAQILYLFSNYSTLYFPKATYVISDDRCIDAIRNKLTSMSVKFHPEAKFIGAGRLPSSMTNTDHRAQYDYTVRFFGAEDSYSLSHGAQVMAIEAVAKSDFTGNAVGMYASAKGQSGSTGAIWALNPLAVASAGFAGKVRAVEIDIENQSASTVDSYGLTMWGGGSYDITSAFKFARSNNKSLYTTGGEIANAKRGLRLSCIGGHPTRSAEHVYGLGIYNCPNDAIIINPQNDNSSKQLSGNSADGTTIVWRINNDGSASFKSTTVTTLNATKLVTAGHTYADQAFKFGAYYLWFASGGVMRASTTVPTNSLDGNAFGLRVAVPATATSTGQVGQWAADANYFYVCTSTDVWKRVAVSSW